MKVKRVLTGYLEENCYLLIKDNCCLVIDPGDDYLKIKKEIGDLKVLAVLITHYHFDHIGALKELLGEFSVPVYDFNSSDEKKYQIGPFCFKVVFNPGHSKDSIRFVFGKEEMMFVGDFIFQGSIGRCDLEGGSFEQMQKSIQSLLKETVNYLIYPGHGPKTTLEYEKKYNAYFS